MPMIVLEKCAYRTRQICCRKGIEYTDGFIVF